MKNSIVVTCLFTLCACNSTAPINGKAVPALKDKSAIHQIGKTDFDRMADVELAENEQSLRVLMIKLYKRNPQELAKSTSESLEKMTDWVFEGEETHHWQFAEISNKQDTEAINLAFDPNYQGDRVLPFIVGLQTMLAKAHNNKKEFYLTDSIDAQKLYNVARNIEIAAWKLGNSRDTNGNLFLLSNEPDAKERNLSFERELGKMIGRTDLYAIALAEKTQRGISRVVQSLATAVFLPF